MPNLPDAEKERLKELAKKRPDFTSFKPGTEVVIVGVLENWEPLDVWRVRIKGTIPDYPWDSFLLVSKHQMSPASALVAPSTVKALLEEVEELKAELKAAEFNSDAYELGLKAAEAERDRMRRALEFYGNEDNWVWVTDEDGNHWALNNGVSAFKGLSGSVSFEGKFLKEAGFAAEAALTEKGVTP